MQGIPTGERQRLGALLAEHSQEQVMGRIAQFGQAEIFGHVQPPETAQASLGARVFNMERGVHLAQIGDFLDSCVRSGACTRRGPWRSGWG